MWFFNTGPFVAGTPFFIIKRTSWSPWLGYQISSFLIFYHLYASYYYISQIKFGVKVMHHSWNITHSFFPWFFLVAHNYLVVVLDIKLLCLSKSMLKNYHSINKTPWNQAFITLNFLCRGMVGSPTCP